MGSLEKLFYALSDKTRLRIVRILMDYSEVCVCKFQEVFQTSQPRVSFHLRILREAGLINGEKKGRWTYYRLGNLPDCLMDLIRKIPADSINQYCEVDDEKG